MSRPFVYFGSTLFISLLIYSYCGVFAAAAVFLVSAVFSVPVFILRRKYDFLRKVFVCLCALLVSSSIFTLRTVTEYAPSQALCNENVCTVSGTFYDYGNDYGNHYYTLKDISVNGQSTPLKIRINSEYKADAEIDDMLTFTVRGISSQEGTAASNSRKAEGIYLRAYSNSAVSVTPAEKHSFNYYCQIIRQWITESLSEIFTRDFAGMADAMLTGNKSLLSRDIQLNFSFSGISHLFAVSGFHLTFWTSVIYFMLRRLPIRDIRLIRSIVSILFVLFFMGLTGFTYSVVRAGIMQIIFYSAGFIRRRADTLNSLFVALTVILIMNPFSAMSVSLQMSFFATLGIVTLSEPLYSFIKDLKTHFSSTLIYRIFSVLFSVATVSLIASLFTVLISAVNFGYYSAVAPITNMLCLSVAELIMPLSLISIIFSFFPPVASPCVFLCNVIMKYILEVTEFISDLSWTVVDTRSAGTVLCLTLITAGVLFCIVMFYQRKKLLRISAIICTAAFLVLSVTVQITDSFTHRITVCDVGNGSSVIVRSGNKNILIGCGGANNSGYVLTNAIDNSNIREFDLILIPRTNTTESSYTFDILKKYTSENTLITAEKFSKITELAMPDNTKRADDCNVRIDGRTNLLYINNERFSGARIVTDKFTCTILFVAKSDFSAVPDEWRSGDLLITREVLPDTDLSLFDNIFVSTDIDRNYDNPDIYTTKTHGTLTCVTTLTGGEKIYADK